MIVTVEDKLEALRMRKSEAVEFGRRVDNIVRRASDPPRGGVGGFCAWLARRLGSPSHLPAEVVATADVDEQRDIRTSSVQVNQRLFGLAGSKANPAQKLDQAASVMRERIELLASRALEQRAEAARLARAGQKVAALRALKKAKMIESQVASNEASVDAVEQQVDLLAQAAMQKTLTTALASTSKSLRTDGKMLTRAEKAIDDASEARDMASDLNSVVAEFATAGSVDDDDLAAELESMLDAVNDVPPPTRMATSDDGVDAADVAALEARVCAWDDRASVRAAASLPSAPVTKREERAGLLAVS